MFHTYAHYLGIKKAISALKMIFSSTKPSTISLNYEHSQQFKSHKMRNVFLLQEINFESPTRCCTYNY